MARRRHINVVLSRSEKAVVFLVALYFGLRKSSVDVRADNLCQAIISPLGYPCNEYTVETSDGFVLGIYNVPYGRAGPAAAPGPPLLLFHGFQVAGDFYFWNSPEESLGTVLADAGYDVWVANNRNVQWSNGNTKYGYNDKQYWDWTWDELSAYDMVSSIEFVYNMRGGTKIFYVGHSQGTMILLAGLTNNAALTAQLTSQLRASVLLAPFAYNSHVTAPLNRLILSSYSDELLPLLGVGPADSHELIDSLCNSSEMNCVDLIRGLLGPDSYINYTRTSFYLQFFPQLTSSKNWNHFGQTFRSGLFQKYDRGVIGNLIAYSQFSPPLYDLSTFPTSLPVQIFSGGLDGLADPADSQHLLSSLPGGANLEVHNFPTYGHLDIVVGYRAYIDIFPLVLSFLSSH